MRRETQGLFLNSKIFSGISTNIFMDARKYCQGQKEDLFECNNHIVFDVDSKLKLLTQIYQQICLNKIYLFGAKSLGGKSISSIGSAHKIIICIISILYPFNSRGECFIYILSKRVEVMQAFYFVVALRLKHFANFSPFQLHKK